MSNRMLDCSRIVVKKFLSTFQFISVGENTNWQNRLKFVTNLKLRKKHPPCYLYGVSAQRKRMTHKQKKIAEATCLSNKFETREIYTNIWHSVMKLWHWEIAIHPKRHKSDAILRNRDPFFFPVPDGTVFSVANGRLFVGL